MSTIEKRGEAIDLARYKQAADEIETGKKDDALWYKAFAEGGGDENATKATYIRLRVDQLRRADVAASAVRVTATQPSPAYTPATPTAKPKQNGAKNLYDVLCITKDAGDEQILAGYQTQKSILDARENQDAETKNSLIFIQHAKKVLLDPVKRAAYDARITAEAAQPEKVGHEKSSGGGPTSASEPLSNSELYQAYLGEKNQAYYLEKFERFDRQDDGMHVSWNWGAFSFFVIWPLYRKMYLWSFSILIISAIFKVIESHATSALLLLFAGSLDISLIVAFVVFSNALYHRKVKKEIATAQRMTRNDNDLIEILREKGGVNSWAVWVFWISLLITITGIVAAVAIPAFSDSTKKAKAQANGNVPQAATVPQNQQSQPLSRDTFSQTPEATTSKEMEQIAAKEESDRIKWLYETKNYEGIVLEFTSDKKFFFSDYYKIGTAFYETGRHAQAVGILLQAEINFPDDSLIKNGLGNSYLSLGDMTNAIKKYQEAEALHPNNTVIKSNFGNAYYSAGDHPNAIKKYREALALDPYNHHAQKGIKMIEQDQVRIANENKREAEQKRTRLTPAEPERQAARVAEDAESQKTTGDIICKMSYGACR